LAKSNGLLLLLVVVVVTFAFVFANGAVEEEIEDKLVVVLVEAGTVRCLLYVLDRVASG
jgi:hypothetical protein